MEDGSVVTRLHVLIAASLWLLAAPGAVAQSSTDRASLHWSLPTTLPPGALAAVVSGDPNGPGESTFLLSTPNGYRVPPHFHPSYELLEVRKGTLLVGMRDTLDPKRTRALPGDLWLDAFPKSLHVLERDLEFRVKHRSSLSAHLTTKRVKS